MSLHLSRAGGFTLIEVLAALAIAATGLMALARTLGSSIEIADATESRTVAYWVAGNHLTELRLARGLPGIGTGSFEVEMAGRRWRIERTIAATPDDDVVKVQVNVSARGNSPEPLARLSGYLARIDPPREAASDGS